MKIKKVDITRQAIMHKCACKKCACDPTSKQCHCVRKSSKCTMLCKCIGCKNVQSFENVVLPEANNEEEEESTSSESSTSVSDIEELAELEWPLPSYFPGFDDYNYDVDDDVK